MPIVFFALQDVSKRSRGLDTIPLMQELLVICRCFFDGLETGLPDLEKNKSTQY